MKPTKCEEYRGRAAQYRRIAEIAKSVGDWPLSRGAQQSALDYDRAIYVELVHQAYELALKNNFREIAKHLLLGLFPETRESKLLPTELVIAIEECRLLSRRNVTTVLD